MDLLTFALLLLVLLCMLLGAGLWISMSLAAVGWVAMTFVFMGARGALLTWRARGDRWLVTGAAVAR